MKWMITLWMFLASIDGICQTNEVSLMNLHSLDPFVFAEVGNSYFVNNSQKGTYGLGGYAISIKVSKYDKFTHQFVKSSHLIGDLNITDSILSPYAQFVQPIGGVLYYVYQRVYPNSATLRTGTYESICLVGIDTNLNVVLPERRIKACYYPLGRFAGCHLQSVTALGDKLIIGYFANDSLLGSLSSNMIVDEHGNVLKDTTAGIQQPNGAPSSRHQIIEIIPYPGRQFIITGSGVNGIASAAGFILADSNMSLLDTFQLKISAGVRGGFYHFPNMVSLPSGSLIAGQEFSTINRPPGVPDGLYTGLTKLRSSNRFAIDTVVAFYGRDSSDVNYSSGPSLHNLHYNAVDNRIYYVNANNLANGVAFNSTCLTPPNYVQVICTDTNLHMYWRKYVMPSNGYCSRITRVVSPGARAGVDIVGMIGEDLYASDTSWVTSFVYHIDSTGTLDVPSEHFSVRDRFRIYPNPTTGIVQVDDLLNELVSISVINMRGEEVQCVRCSSSPMSINIAGSPSGNYLIKVQLKDGNGFTKIISKTDQ